MCARGEMDITKVYGTFIWGSSPYGRANLLIIKRVHFGRSELFLHTACTYSSNPPMHHSC